MMFSASGSVSITARTSRNASSISFYAPGPAGLSVAIGIHDHPDGKLLKAHYIEAQPEYAWHPGMLIPGYTV